MRLLVSESQQNEMRHAFLDGAPGALVSGLIWMVSALVCHLLDINRAVWVLLIGGAFIYPLSIVLTKALGRSGNAKANALNQLAMASTIWLILSCAMCYGLFLLKPALFFPAMMATIGSRYLVFATVYGRAIFWLMGGCLIGAGLLALFLAVPPAGIAGIGGIIEILFAIVLMSHARKLAQPTPGP